MQHSTSQSFIVEWPDGSNSLVKAHDSPVGVPKGKDSDHDEQDSLVG